MRLLCFQARRFGWHSHAGTLDDEASSARGDGVPVGDAPAGDAPAGDAPAELGGERVDCLVVFAQAERGDAADEARARVVRHTIKHVKWLANKRGLRDVVLHSFAHLGAEPADPAFARALLEDLAARLGDAGYRVACTPFGHSCAWELAVHGDGIAKVYKQI